ncbi:PD-(D/E)XK nuclease-like domain-containing protein [Shewanella sp. SW32]|uniref:PD-(D/E)XK nuclease-like domain-containing protein n=1 Tax=unclassified Shewanella TaxID=196818 RepID=UPI0021D9F59C|nr:MULTISPECIES: PD-(D/E)XK nuclease-like domain-containing protein [unclassified Shewanella]MCU7961186.1 PD-(D/E)XK nuclease-like domain-containing protein [Shewanella sp. SW32]MCU7969268.1 PD-(D/E)XK nuclease-like domain-containing protein [Shewanella sp. SW29]
MSKLFKMTFNPMASAPKGTCSITYCIEVDSLADAERQAETNLAAEGYNRRHFRRNIESHCTLVNEQQDVSEPVKTEVITKSEPIKAAKCDGNHAGPSCADPECWNDDIKPSSVNDDSFDDDPFAAFAPPAWTIETLNVRLEQLAPGERLIIDDLPDDIYHGAIGVSSSKLKLFIECPQKYYAKYIAKIIPDAEKAYFDFGKAIHTVFLQPWLFESSYVCQPEEIKIRSSKVWYAFKEKADAAGQVVLTQAQWDDMPILRQSLESNAKAKALTTGGVAERSIFTRDVETGLIIKCRPDYMIGKLIIDLKSDASADPRFFGPKAKKLGYHIQDALYTDVAGADEFAFLVVESCRPFVITAPVILDANVKRLGYLKYRKAMRELKRCMTHNVWPAYTDLAVTVGLNHFEQQDLEALENELTDSMEHAA